MGSRRSCFKSAYEFAGTLFPAEATAMRSKVMAAVVLAIGMVTVSVPLFAHHGTAAFENDKKVTLKGTVTEWLWSNPHCLLQFDVKGDDGTVTILQVKNGLPLGRVVSVALPNGKTLISGEGASREVRDQLEREAREARP